jgi:hypothetical protein
MKKKLGCLLPVIFLIITTNISAQKRSLQFGGKLINELVNHGYGPGIGADIVYKITKHSGIVTGLYFKIDPHQYTAYSPGRTYSVSKFSERTIMVPLLYKFESKLVTLTAGGTVSYILNYRESDKLFTHLTGQLEPAVTISISKSFYFGKSLVFEPEIRASAPIPEGGVGTGLNLSLRKTIF